MLQFNTRTAMHRCLLLSLAAIVSSASAEEPMRPGFHFTAEKNWLNDPNGLVWYAGEYHLFYQHNPFGDTWGHMSWGHAVSRDLLRWEHLPVAIPEKDGIMAFSGSAVVDHANTSGFGTPTNPPMVAIYTGHREGRQDQRIAWSLDKGRTWTLFAGNPVLDVQKADFRDPKVFWHAPTKRWVMVVALPVERKVSFYASTDLKKWEFLSDFGPAGSVAGIWECPDLFEVPVQGTNEKRWVLNTNLGDHTVSGGSGAQYFTGTFDGKAFHADPLPPGVINWVDYGRDMYAAVTWNDTPDKTPLWVGWMSNWKYAGATPTSPWRCAMSLPRTLELRKSGDRFTLLQNPVKTLESWRRPPLRIANQPLAAANRALEGVKGKRFDLLLRIAPGDAAEAGLKLRVGGAEETRVGWSRERGEVFVDRTKSGNTGFHAEFPGRHAAPLPLRGGLLDLRVVTDDCSVEVFADGGAVVITDLIFPSASSQGLAFFSAGGEAKVVAAEIHPLEK